jgi:hypothetical protein
LVSLMSGGFYRFGKAALLSLAVALGACSAQDLASTYCGSAPPTSNNPIVPQLLYPVPGITGVPHHAPELVVAYGLSPYAAFPITITPQGGSAIQLASMRPPPNPLPQPLAKELKPGTPMYGVTLPTLLSHVKYSVAYKDTVSYCGRTFVNNYNMGSFTTQ